jgi:amidase
LNIGSTSIRTFASCTKIDAEGGAGSRAPSDLYGPPESDAMTDPLGAFVPGVDVRLSGRPGGPLDGLTFAAKDLFDVQGFVTGCGNPDWAATHAAAERSAAAVEALLNAGATLIGKTITDEISLGLLGVNRFYGTPLNPRAPDRVPGGSSSGSASAVAGGACDIALGTDSGGSVRVPASFCGLFGLRPTLGRIDGRGMMVQSPTFDTVGYFTRDAETFARVGAVLLGEPVVPAMPEEIIVATDAFAIADGLVRDALSPAVERCRTMAHVTQGSLADGDLLEWARWQRVLQRHEFRATFREWIDKVNPRFSSEVAGAFADDGQTSAEVIDSANRFRAKAKVRLEALLDGRRMLCIPTSPILPIARDARLSAMRDAVHRIVELTGIAGLTSLPQVNIPAGSASGIPVGLSLIGWRGGEAVLVGAACALAEAVCPRCDRELFTGHPTTA